MYVCVCVYFIRRLRNLNTMRMESGKKQSVRSSTNCKTSGPDNDAAAIVVLLRISCSALPSYDGVHVG